MEPYSINELGGLITVVAGAVATVLFALQGVRESSPPVPDGVAACVSARLSCLSVGQSVSVRLCPSVSVCLSVSLSVSLSVCLSVSLLLQWLPAFLDPR